MGPLILTILSNHQETPPSTYLSEGIQRLYYMFFSLVELYFQRTNHKHISKQHCKLATPPSGAPTPRKYMVNVVVFVGHD